MSARRQSKPPATTVASAPAQTKNMTASVARAGLNQAPAGQTQTTVDRSQFDDRPAFTVGDILGQSSRHICETGQRTARYRYFDPRLQRPQRLRDPQPGDLRRRLSGHATGRAIPKRLDRSSRLRRNRCHQGSVVGALWQLCDRRCAQFSDKAWRHDRRNRVWSGWRELRISRQLSGGWQEGRQLRSFAVCERRAGDGFIGNSWFNTQTVNFLATWQATWDDRFTVKFINNDLDTRLPIRSSLNQFQQNPFQQGCATGATAAPGCGTVKLFNNGFNTAAGTSNETAEQAGLGRDDRRTLSAGGGSMISTIRRPGEINSFSTTGTSISRPVRPAQLETFRRTII